MKLFGLKSCDTCRKALKDLRTAGFVPEFVDLRQEGIGAARIEEFYRRLGDGLVNRRSTTWRGLGATERNEDARTLLRQHPALMKRQVIDTGEQLYLGWNAQTRSAVLG